MSPNVGFDVRTGETTYQVNHLANTVGTTPSGVEHLTAPLTPTERGPNRHGGSHGILDIQEVALWGTIRSHDRASPLTAAATASGIRRDPFVSPPPKRLENRVTATGNPHVCQ